MRLNRSEPEKGEPMMRNLAKAALLRVLVPSLVMISQAEADDTPVAIISDQIRKQGYPCDEPRQAERDQQASRPNEAVWILRCGNVAYRVTLVPDMAARVELVK
jgi:hypothetical protein